MIERYSRKEIKNIWKITIDILYGSELAAAEAMEESGIPKGVVKKVRSKAKINRKEFYKLKKK